MNIMTVKNFMNMVRKDTRVKLVSSMTDKTIGIYTAQDIPQEYHKVLVYDFTRPRNITNLFIEIPTCSVCGKPMFEGYCIADGDDYYCSDDCLHTLYSDAEYDEMYNSDNAYWTDWCD